jgi:hypothetical protein
MSGTQGLTADLVSAEACLAATPGPNRKPLSAAAPPLEAAVRRRRGGKEARRRGCSRQAWLHRREVGGGRRPASDEQPLISAARYVRSSGLLIQFAIEEQYGEDELPLRGQEHRRLPPPSSSATSPACTTSTSPAASQWLACAERESSPRIDRKLIALHGIAKPRCARARRRLAGTASIHYLRHNRFFLLIATHGKHALFTDHATTTRDIRRQALHAGGYAFR